ncbi:MAG: helicase [Proteobacteria bacterium]|nr:MAG: helicase [Pseudomonadota bacterium]
MIDLEALFAADGPLARAVPAYKLRMQQLEMARAVAEAIEARGILIAEAGTGTGKTFAYLAPALLSGGKVIISTGTKTLQDQLFNRDIPTLRNALRVPVTVALLKGRANYVCHYHLQRQVDDGRFVHRDDVGHLRKIVSYARTSKTGDRSGLADLPEDAGIWPLVTSTRENCLGSECPRYQECFVMEARKQALAADVVVVNHHLFFADLMLRDEGVAELLPACNTVIFDEAHQLPDTASLFFGHTVSTAQLLELARDTRVEAAASAKDFAPLPEAAVALDRAARDLRLSVPDESGRHPARTIEAGGPFRQALDKVVEKLKALETVLEFQADRSEGLANCLRRSQLLAAQVGEWRSASESETVRWVELFHASLQLNSTPLSIAEIVRKQLTGSARSWIFTSATLSVKGDFSHYQGEMGLGSARALAWESPFDYPNQAVLYVPSDMPEPNSAGYTRAVIEAVLPVLAASDGRAFLLFTSLRAMREAYELLQVGCAQRGYDYPLLLQGEGPRSELLERFRRLGNAVLVASQSFWEGVDVRGEALSLVMIDRLPFQPPDDPVLAARVEKMNAAGRNAFMEYQVPQAVITLKQGAGRLIRDETDRGVLMICDTRLIAKPYGRRMWQSLPPMKRTRELDEVLRFFASAKEGMRGAEDREGGGRKE